jgi:hypothetical protein
LNLKTLLKKTENIEGDQDEEEAEKEKEEEAEKEEEEEKRRRRAKEVLKCCLGTFAEVRAPSLFALAFRFRVHDCMSFSAFFSPPPKLFGCIVKRQVSNYQESKT